MLPSILLALVIGLPSQFTRTAATVQPVLEGPSTIVSRARVADQPGSPLRILRVDFSGTKVFYGESVLEIEFEVTVDVQNVGDDTVRDPAVCVGLHTGDGAVAGCPRRAAPIPPGATARLGLKPSRARLTTWEEKPRFEIVVSASKARAGCVAHAGVSAAHPAR